MRRATEMALQWNTSCQRGVRIVKMAVHQRNGMSETPNSEAKFGRNHVRGGLQNTRGGELLRKPD